MNILLPAKYSSALTIFTTLCLVGCATPGSRYQMDDSTAEHPATQRFLKFIASVEKAENFEELVEEYYTLSSQKRAPKAMGWAQFVYSAPYKVLKNGQCESIHIKPFTNRVQLDCIGTMTVRSLFLGENEEHFHLRVMMLNQLEQWQIDKSGYVHTNSSNGPVTLSKFGIKFDSKLGL